MTKIRLTEAQLKRVVTILKEQEDSEYYNITPEEYKELMMYAGYNGNSLSKLKKFGGKPLRITGNVNLSSTPTTSLGNVAIIDGDLDVSRTKVSDVSKINIQGRVSDYDTPISRRRERLEQLKKMEEAQSRREDNEWGLDNEYIDDEGLKANALYEYLINNGDLEGLTGEDLERIEQIRTTLSQLENQYDEAVEPEIISNLSIQISELEDELEELIDKGDVYSIIPTNYSHYELTNFEVIGLTNQEYAVGTEEEVKKSAYDYGESLIDDIGIEGFNEHFIENHIDTDSVVDYFESWWRDDIYESPESYFDDDDYKLTEEQERRIEILENQISQYEELQSELDSSDDEYDEYQELIDELQEELDEIVPEIGEPTDEMVEDKLEERLSDIRRNPLSYIKDYGLEVKNFVDEESLIEDMVNTDGYGILSSYDGSYETIEINGEDYYIFRIN
jgi:PKD repeat protein